MRGLHIQHRYHGQVSQKTEQPCNAYWKVPSMMYDSRVRAHELVSVTRHCLPSYCDEQLMITYSLQLRFLQ